MFFLCLFVCLRLYLPILFVSEFTLTSLSAPTHFATSIGVVTGHGGPFGAVIVEASTNTIIARGCNKVLLTNDPTAHAEVVAIREACAKLNRFSLHDCVIYASCQPCPMCLSAIVWAKLPRCVYSASPNDAAQAGFDDRFLYDYIQGKPVVQKLVMTHAPHPDSSKPFEVYAEALRQNRSGRYWTTFTPFFCTLHTLALYIRRLSFCARSTSCCSHFTPPERSSRVSSFLKYIFLCCIVMYRM